jgi:hypothetical protein
MLLALLSPPSDTGVMWSPWRRLPGSPGVPQMEHHGCIAMALARRLRHWRVYGLGPTLGLRLGWLHFRRRHLGHGVSGRPGLVIAPYKIRFGNAAMRVLRWDLSPERPCSRWVPTPRGPTPTLGRQRVTVTLGHRILSKPCQYFGIVGP